MILPGRLTPGLIFGTIAIAILLAASPTLAEDYSSSTPSTGSQSQANTSTAQSTQPSQTKAQTPAEQKEQRREQQTGTSNDRILWAMPNFATVANEGQYPPLSVGQKFSLVARGTFDYFEIPWIAVQAGLSQAENTESGYGQGMEGYAKRYGAHFADSAIENFMVGGVMPSALRQDPRYYQLGKGGFWHRTAYAVTRMFVTRSDSGNAQFNFSEIGGSLGAAAISNYSYHPSADRNVPNMLKGWGTQVSLDSFTTTIKEFWPDIHRKFTRKKAPPS